MRLFLNISLFAIFLVPIFFVDAAIVPACEGNSCRACDLVTLINNIVDFLIWIGVFLAVLSIAFTGFSIVLSGESGSHALGHTLSNVAIGFIVMLSAWLIVDTFLKILIDDRNFGPWNEIQCVNNPAILSPGDGDKVDPGLIVGAGQNASLGKADCSPDNILSAASTGGYSLTRAQAETLSCLSGPESGCNNSPGTARTPDGRPTTASGVFQIVMGYGDTCHSLNMPVCTEAAQRAGYPVSGNLNCSTAFRGGTVKPGMENLAAACKAAASNFNCNTSAAACLVQKNRGSFSDWTSDKRSSRQASCIATFNR